MNTTTKKTLFLGIVVCVIALFLNGMVGYRNTQQLYEAQSSVTHTHNVLRELDRLAFELKSAESAIRGYVINYEPVYLESYESSARLLDTLVDHIAELTNDNPTQQENIKVLRTDIGVRMDLLKNAIKIRQEKGYEGIVRLAKTGNGLAIIGRLNDQIERIKTEENRLLNLRAETYRNCYTFAITSVSIAAVFGVAVVLAFSFLLTHHIRKQLESVSTLYQQKELFRITLASIGDGVITTDMSGNVTFLNAVAEKLTGWNNRNAARQSLETVFNIVNQDTRAQVDNPAKRALREGVIVGLANHTVLISKNGEEYHIDDSAAPIRNDKNEIQGAVLVFRDISERKKVDDALRESDLRKDEFLATLAHELRNPLAPISNSLHVLSQSNLSPEAFSALHGIMTRQIQQMVRLVDDLLDISRINQNKLELRKEITSIEVIVANAMETCEPMLRASGHQVKVTLPPSPLYVEVDKIRFSQALGNLVNNAAKYTPAGGQIEVKVESNNGAAELSVKDSGLGIPPEMLEKIFEMFIQVERSLDRSQGGLGIGLTLVKRIVNMHGGRVSAVSKGSGQGSEFIISVPQVTPPVVSKESPVIPAAPKNKVKVLVTDDNQDSAETMSMLFSLDGNEVATAFDGFAALELAESFRPDVILLDIGMPNLDGYETARRIRANPWGKSMFLIALTGWGKEEDKKMARDAGFDVHLVKPVDYDKLKEVLANRK